jgi:hypothetical protein
MRGGTSDCSHRVWLILSVIYLPRVESTGFEAVCGMYGLRVVADVCIALATVSLTRSVLIKLLQRHTNNKDVKLMGATLEQRKMDLACR